MGEQTLEANKLIANFVGLRQVDSYAGLRYKFQEEYSTTLKFNYSWDWLMFAVAKCVNEVPEIDSHDKLFQTINNGLMSADIDDTYDAVVNFIKAYNNERRN